ncbi:MAG: hypothetical protein NC402_03095 [Prevotella sp.]|nr:hypothetical protein [Prevotella sp.]MCM1075107.1 hypothetical protein [Ruminococcus sp.]
MNIIRKAILFSTAALLCTFSAKAQYYQAINQATNMLQTAIQGGFNYRGMIDASYTTGIGTNGCSSLEFSTTQGFKYANWFFMGVGAGVNVAFAGEGDDNHTYNPGGWGNGYDPYRRVKDTGVIMPLFTDFRFYIGNEQDVNLFIGMKVGASFLIGKNYLRTPDGYLDNNEGFYFKPTIGVRVPLSSDNPKYAVNFGVSYQLITNSYWNWGGYYSNTTVNSLGATIGFEW